MIIHAIRFERDSFAALPKPEQSFLCHISILQTDMDILRRSVILSMNGMNHRDEIWRKAQLVQSLYFIFQYSACVYEGWKMIDRYWHKKQLGKKYIGQLSEEQKQDLEYLKRYFSNDNIIKAIRQRIAHHYEIDDILENIENLPDASKMDMYCNAMGGNSFSFWGYGVIWNAIIAKTFPKTKELEYPEQLERASRVATEMMTEVSGHLQCLCESILSIYSKKLNISVDQLEIADPPSAFSSYFPYFITG